MTALSWVRKAWLVASHLGTTLSEPFWDAAAIMFWVDGPSEPVVIGTNRWEAGRPLRPWPRLGRMAAAFVLSGAVLAAARGEAEVARLGPVPDETVANLLEARFTLPMELEFLGQSHSDPWAVIDAEVSKLTGLLVARGYLEARIEISGAATQDDPLQLRPIPGPFYRIGIVRIEGLPAHSGTGMLTAISALASKWEGSAALSGNFKALRAGLLFELRQASYSQAALEGTAIALDRGMGRADLVMSVDPGSPMRFGDVAFRGSVRMADVDAAALVPFRTGDPYSETAMDALRSALERTGRFRRIRIETTPHDAAPDVLNLTVRLRDKAVTPVGDAKPVLLMAAIGMTILVQSLRVTPSWSDRVLRRFFLGAATVMSAGAVVEVVFRVYGFVQP